MPTHSHDQNPNKYPADRLGYLFAQHLRRQLSIQEQEELDRWRKANDGNEAMFQRLTEPSSVEKWLREYKQVDVEASLQQVKSKMKERKRQRRIRFISYIAAACLVGIIFWIRFWPASDSIPIKLVDAAPGKAQAVLQLEDGQRINILSVPADTLLQGGIQLHRDSIRLQYAATGGAIEWHELHVPAAGFFQLQLADGTRVWINNSSTLRYPSRFNGTERKVELSGEAYFEVASDTQHPFRVYSGDQRVEAVGTAFVIQAFPEDSAWTTTLTEGKVLVSANEQRTLLSPAQAATWSNNSLSPAASASIASATAWVRQEFYWRQADASEVCRQLSRWYGNQVRWVGKHPLQINATVSRNMPLSRVLSALEKTGEVKVSRFADHIELSN